jgi:hypothetical protein
MLLRLAFSSQKRTLLRSLLKAKTLLCRCGDAIWLVVLRFLRCESVILPPQKVQNYPLLSILWSAHNYYTKKGGEIRSAVLQQRPRIYQEYAFCS